MPIPMTTIYNMMPRKPHTSSQPEGRAGGTPGNIITRRKKTI